MTDFDILIRKAPQVDLWSIRAAPDSCRLFLFETSLGGASARTFADTAFLARLPRFSVRSH